MRTRTSTSGLPLATILQTARAPLNRSQKETCHFDHQFVMSEPNLMHWTQTTAKMVWYWRMLGNLTKNEGKVSHVALNPPLQ